MSTMSYETAEETVNRQFESAIADAEELVKATASLADENIGRLRTKAQRSLQTAKAKISDARDAIETRAREAADVVEARVRERPWESLGVVAALSLAVGIAAGVLISRD